MRAPQAPLSLPPPLGASLHRAIRGAGVLLESSPALTCERLGPDLQGGSLAGGGPALILPSAPPRWGGRICRGAGAHPFSFSPQVKISAHQDGESSQECGWPGATAAGSRGECPAAHVQGMGPTQGRGALRERSCSRQWLLTFLFSQRLKARTRPAPSPKTRNAGQQLQNYQRVPSAVKREAQRNGADAFFLSHSGRRSRIHLISGMLTTLRSDREEMAAIGIQMRPWD